MAEIAQIAQIVRNLLGAEVGFSIPNCSRSPIRLLAVKHLSQPFGKAEMTGKRVPVTNIGFGNLASLTAR